MAGVNSYDDFSYTLRKFVEKRPLPASVEVVEGMYGDRTGDSMSSCDFSNGDLLTLVRVKKVVHATFDSIYAHQPSQRGLIVVPLYFGGYFRLQHFNRRNYLYTTVKELAQAFPRFAKSEKLMKFENVALRPGNRIELLRKIEDSPGVWSIHCVYLSGKTSTEFKMPFEAACLFSACDDDVDYLLPQFVHRLPQKVQFSPISQSNHGIKGLPESCSEEFFLSFMQVIESIQYSDKGLKSLTLPLDTDIDVKLLSDPQKSLYLTQKIVNIHEIPTSQLPADVRITSETEEILDKNLRDMIVKVEKMSTTLKKLLAVTDSGQIIMISTTFDGQFIRAPRMFDTALDLWEAHSNGKLNTKVEVTKTILSSQSECDSVHQTEILEPVDIENVVFTDEGEEDEDLIICKLYETPKHVTKIKIPTYTNGRFREVIEDKHKLYSAAELNDFPLPVRVQLADTSVAQRRKFKGYGALSNQKINIIRVFQDAVTRITPLSGAKLNPLLVSTRKPIFCQLQAAKQKPLPSKGSSCPPTDIAIEVITDEEYQQLNSSSSYESISLKPPVIPPKRPTRGHKSKTPPPIPPRRSFESSIPLVSPTLLQRFPLPHSPRSPKEPPTISNRLPSGEPPSLPTKPRASPRVTPKLTQSQSLPENCGVYDRLSKDYTFEAIASPKDGYITPREIEIPKDKPPNDIDSDSSDEKHDYEEITDLPLTKPKKPIPQSRSSGSCSSSSSRLPSDTLNEEDMPNDYEEVPVNLFNIREKSKRGNITVEKSTEMLPDISNYSVEEMCRLLKKFDFKKEHIKEFKKKKIDGRACLKFQLEELEAKYGLLHSAALWGIIKENKEKY